MAYHGTVSSNVDHLSSLMLAKLTTGNQIIDSLLGIFAITSAQSLASMVSDIRSLASSSVYSVIRLVILLYRIIRKKQELITRTVHIKYFTDDREINMLYEDMVWYINTVSNFIQEEELSVEITKTRDSLTSRLPKTRSSSFVFDGTTINYKIYSEIITLYADREQKKENFTITLWADLPKEGSTVFNRLVEVARKMRADASAKKTWKQLSHRNSKGVWSQKDVKFGRRINTVVLKEGQCTSIVRDIDSFVNHQDWYVSRDIPYTRRYLFYGCPGSGKSSMIKALATYLKRNIHYLILSDVKSDSELFTLLENINHSTTILVLEDVDCACDITRDREILPIKEVPPIQEEKKEEKEPPSTLTLSGLLNALDGGMIDNHGQIAIMTTNHIDRIDPALIRPGRIDCRYEFGPCDRYQLESLFVNFFEHSPPKTMYSIDIEVTPATVVSVFLKNKNDSDAAWNEILSIVSKNV